MPKVNAPPADASPPFTGETPAVLDRGHLGLLAGGKQHRPDLLHCHLQFGGVHDRVREVPPVHPDEVRLRKRSGRIGGADIEGAPAVGGGVGAHAPGAADVVLEPGAADGGVGRVAVEEHLHLPLSVPDALVEDPDPEAASEIAPRPDQALR